MVTLTKEREQKYDAPSGATLPPLGDLPRVAAESEQDKQTLEAEYFDTADLRLLRAGVTLRRRRGGLDAGWHLKLPAAGGWRDEIRLPLGRAARHVPGELAALVRAHTRQEELRPVALITTIRRRTVLRDGAGESLAEVVADDVSAQAMGDAAVLSTWHEIEVELTGGDVKLLRAADERLRRSGLRPAGRLAKLERALADQLPAADGRPRLTPASPAAEVILAYAGRQVAALKSFDPRVRRGEPDSVHQLRVAARRLRSTLKSFRSVLRGADVKRIRGELKWLAALLGDSRDGEVLARHLRVSVGQLPPELVLGPVQARVRRHFAPLEAAASQAVLAALDSARYFALLHDLDHLLASPPLTARAGAPARDILPAAVRRTRRRLRRRVRRARRVAAGPARDGALHEVRKAAKEARYTADAVSPAFGKKARRFAKRMKEVQSILGDHHDAVTQRGVARELGVQASLAGENAFSFGLLYARDENRAAMLEPAARRAWRRALRPTHSRWMR